MAGKHEMGNAVERSTWRRRGLGREKYELASTAYTRPSLKARNSAHQGCLSANASMSLQVLTGRANGGAVEGNWGQLMLKQAIPFAGDRARTHA